MFNKIRINNEISKAILKMHQEEEKNKKDNASPLRNYISNSFTQKYTFSKTFSHEINNISNSSTESNSSIKSNISYQNNLPLNYNYKIFNFPFFNILNLDKTNFTNPLFSLNTSNINTFDFPIAINNCNNCFNNQIRNVNYYQYDNNNKFEPKKRHKK